MAGTSLLTLLDDIASILDDVAAMSKVAARKTASVLSDDLALNAEQVSGVKADRELPVVWKVAKGSLLNKAILVPLALVISAWLPWAITPLLMVGGAYLSYKGVEKLIENWHHRQAKKQRLPDPRKGVNPSEAGPSKMADEPALADAPSVSDAAAVDKDAVPNRGREALLALENDKVKGAVRTDFILSAEIIVISLNIVAQAPLLNQIAVMVLIALVMTLGVYGIVAAIVKMDDLGLYMSRLTGQGASRALLRRVGAGIVSAAPLLMKTLSVVGTIAMFLVGGSILAHGFPWTHGLIDSIGEHYRGLIGTLVISLSDMLLGLIAGTIVVLAVALIKKCIGRGQQSRAG
ncbi:DUF808 domain-containing protein [Sodalis sp.]|uniref:DUF808 domain-containing protein n=1 Tax=Sodalis sp. (in: enterobacteria) TaxID=1898979 RepID=UPI003873C19F